MFESPSPPPPPPLLRTSQIVVCLHSKTPRSNLTRKGSIGAKFNSGSTMTRKSINLTRNMTQSWVILTPLYVKSAESCPNSWSLLTRNWVWPQWTREFLECMKWLRELSYPCWWIPGRSGCSQEWPCRHRTRSRWWRGSWANSGRRTADWRFPRHIPYLHAGIQIMSSSRA